MAELTEVVGQMGDTQIMEMLNKICTVGVNNIVETTLTSIISIQHETSSQADALHLFAVKALANTQNKSMINPLHTECVQIKAIDKFPSNIIYSGSGLEFIRSTKLSVSSNLA